MRSQVHFDFELDNLIWYNDQFSIIDFDDSVYSWFIADVAYALRDLYDEGNNIDFLDERFTSFMKGYREMTSLSDDLITQIPYFYRFHNYISFKRLERAIDLVASEDHPQWMNELIDKLVGCKNQYYENFHNRKIWINQS